MLHWTEHSENNFLCVFIYHRQSRLHTMNFEGCLYGLRWLSLLLMRTWVFVWDAQSSWPQMNLGDIRMDFPAAWIILFPLRLPLTMGYADRGEDTEWIGSRVNLVNNDTHSPFTRLYYSQCVLQGQGRGLCATPVLVSGCEVVDVAARRVLTAYGLPLCCHIVE